MPSYKVGRVAEDIRRELAYIIRDVKDPRVTGMLSVVKVDLTNDLSYAKVYISAVEGGDTARKAVEGLQHAAAFIRSRLNENIRLRKMPELKFIADDSVQYAEGISKIIDSLHKGQDMQKDKAD